MSEVKRWQFTIRGIIGYITMVALPLGTWPLGFRLEGDFISALIGYVAILSTGGVVGATLGWLISGKEDGFLIGYAAGAFPSLLIVVLAIF